MRKKLLLKKLFGSKNKFKNKFKVLECLNHSPHLNPTDTLWHELKQATHAWKHFSVVELKQFCKEELAKIPPQFFFHMEVGRFG